uniref:Uncharacterized protein n=1 Tax=uncultured Gemmatimonadales bacterium HF0770_41L09 TaxID=723617 RepID=E7C7V1_9BACT|nr:hypothetical protein [uncultured Gemmatimonadales bacterium HF0770_41L09]
MSGSMKIVPSNGGRITAGVVGPGASPPQVPANTETKNALTAAVVFFNLTPIFGPGFS